MEDVDTIYAVPVELSREGLDAQILRHLKLEERPSDMRPWLDLVYRMHNPAGEIRIAVVGKYVQLEDAYKSLPCKRSSTVAWRTIKRLSSNGSKPKKSTPPKPRPRAYVATMEFLSPAASANAASRA